VVHVDDVVDDTRDALRQLGRGPTQAIRSSPVTMAALLRISEPVHRRPMLVSSRTVTGGPPRDW